MTYLLLRKRALAALTVGLLCGCVPVTEPEDAAPAVASSQPHEQPNIVLVLFEDLGPRFGAFGDSLAQTPNFDRIAAEGVKYTNVFTTAGVCAPSRAALITGRHAASIGAQHMRTHGYLGAGGGGPQDYYAVPPAAVKAFPELLRAGGYHTSNDWKTDYQFGEPFTVWDASREGADWTGRGPRQPFFHMRTLLTTHESFIWPTDMEARTPLEKAVVARNRKVFAGRVPSTDPADVSVPPYLPDAPAVRRDIATHYDNIAFTDKQLGALYERLDAEGLLDNTILIVSTDHGDGLPRMKRSLYDSGLHVPMVIRYPDGWGAGTVDKRLISFVDLAPTILSWAGLPAPEWMHGRVFAGPDRDPPRDHVFAAQDRVDRHESRRRAVRDERYKLIRNERQADPYFIHTAFRDAQPTMKVLWALNEQGRLPEPASRLFEALPRYQLYDLQTDPHEVRNLAGDPALRNVQTRLEGALNAWLARIGDIDKPEVDLIAAMWPNGVQPVTAPPAASFQRDGALSTVALSSATDGASIGYRTDANETWTLYVRPLPVEPGQTLYAQAIRYGFAVSEVVEIRQAAAEH